MLSSLDADEQHKVDKREPNEQGSDTPLSAPKTSATRCRYANDGGCQQLETVQQKGPRRAAGRRSLKLELVGVRQCKEVSEYMRSDDASACERDENTVMQPRKRVSSIRHSGTLTPEREIDSTRAAEIELL